MADDLAEDLEHSPNVFGAALNGLFAHVPHEAGHVAPSEHLTHGARENQQLAIIIGQLQHLIQLAETVIAPALPPVPFAIAQGVASVTVDPPVAPCVLHEAVISMDGANALAATITISAPSLPGGSKVVAQGKLNENSALTLRPDAYTPPDCTGITVTPATTAAGWSGTLTFRPVIPGRYPYVG